MCVIWTKSNKKYQHEQEQMTCLFYIRSWLKNGYGQCMFFLQKKIKRRSYKCQCEQSKICKERQWKQERSKRYKELNKEWRTSGYK